jgi:hypothetical protein
MQGRAVLQFLADGEELLHGAIERGGWLRIEYDIVRLRDCFIRWGEDEYGMVVANIRFHPRGEVWTGAVSAAVRQRPGGGAIGHRAVPVEVRVPDDAEQAELWFHGYSQTDCRCDTWDSRFGENYWYAIGGPPPRTPAQPVAFRIGAQVRPDLLSVLNYTATKSEGRRSVALALSLWSRDSSPDANAWIDFHLFDAEDRLVHSRTVSVPFAQHAMGDVYEFRGEIYPPQGAEEPAEAHKFQFRAYCEIGHRCYTDGVLREAILLPAAVPSA